MCSNHRRIRLSGLILAPLVLFGLVITTTAHADTGHPRLGLYGSILGDWRPFVRSDGSLDTTTIARVARTISQIRFCKRVEIGRAHV